MVDTVLTKVRGIVEAVSEESVTLAVEPLEIEVLIPEHTRRPVQAKRRRAGRAAHDLLHRGRCRWWRG